MARDRIPTSRVARTAKLGSLAAGQAVRQAGTRAANVARSKEDSQAALERRHLDAAEQIVTALGTMKGAAMKLGQVLSFLDVGLVPEEHREEFQAKLAALRDAAPKVGFKDMRKVIEEELDDELGEVFATFEEQPIAAASIGQVYRATLHDGRDVAVKVQYPGVAAAVRADMQNLGLLMRLVKRMAPGLDAKAIAEEIRLRIDEELDYELEAQNQRSLARIFRGHPFIHVPDVVTRLSRERVIVSEFVEGKGFEELKRGTDAERNRLGEIVFRFFFGCLYRHHQFSGDPHPGNFLLQADGRVAFLDFGLFKRMAPEAVELELAAQRAVAEDDAKRLHELLGESGFLPHPEKVNAEAVFAYVVDSIWWYTADEEILLTPEIATRVAIESSDMRSSHFREMRHQDIRPEHLFGDGAGAAGGGVLRTGGGMRDRASGGACAPRPAA
jgi:predicted unusual protein kinase regulating ubiquinone biosynthesis (AarF/ABC1/UbiB family)